MYPQQSPPTLQVTVDSWQHRTPKVTPCRQLSPEQQSAAVVHNPWTIEQVQLPEVQSQSAHEPVVGPEKLPEAHVPLDSHQPQLLNAVQAPHAVSEAQGSGPTHSERSHAQLPQLPVSGPLELPSAHPPVSPHHPQGKTPVQASQSVRVPQVEPPHSEPSQLQSPHDPPVGPLLAPVRQPPPPSPHHPQLPRAVHAAQSAASAQGSVGPMHWLESQAQSPQLPESGPLEVPSVQPPPSHHPHGKCSVHSPQSE